ncbi:MAG: Hsp20/alpha crystallin family protein [Candidatus Pseudobacter hemicellulosilyticus]|uniref:Hsp20/alpha crystallin family protein n=1 Tax=Candidatus Pseudobacter hemicellulosilyticus TaxID=3121375 RepID=A0AAJ6BDX8_9BACT|nr:MAG: Hsp20/alpha crystallin family protein [Pseudobacter sp.]
MKAIMSNPSDRAIVRTFCGEFSDIEHLEQEVYPENRIMPLAAVNVLETDSAYVFEMALPGYRKNDLELALEEDLLTVHARAPYLRHKDVRRLYKQEFAPGDLSRSFLLPEDAGLAAAHFTDGVLTIRFSKELRAAAPGPDNTISILIQ